MSAKPRVLITTCTGTAWLHKHVAMAGIRMLNDERVESNWIMPTHRPYEHNLNRCVKQFLHEGYDFWINMDDDNPTKGNPIDLVFLDLDIVGCPTPVWHSEVKGDRPFYFNALDWDDARRGWTPHEVYSGLQSVDAIGSGCMVIARRVLEAPAMKAPFNRTYTDEGIVDMGHDYVFCTRAREAGFKVWAHFDYPCMHFNELELTEVIDSFQALFQKLGPPAPPPQRATNSTTVLDPALLK